MIFYFLAIYEITVLSVRTDRLSCINMRVIIIIIIIIIIKYYYYYWSITIS